MSERHLLVLLCVCVLVAAAIASWQLRWLLRPVPPPPLVNGRLQPMSARYDRLQGREATEFMRDARDIAARSSAR